MRMYILSPDLTSTIDLRLRNSSHAAQWTYTVHCANDDIADKLCAGSVPQSRLNPSPWSAKRKGEAHALPRTVYPMSIVGLAGFLGLVRACTDEFGLLLTIRNERRDGSSMPCRMYFSRGWGRDWGRLRELLYVGGHTVSAMYRADGWAWHSLPMDGSYP